MAKATKAAKKIRLTRLVVQNFQGLRAAAIEWLPDEGFIKITGKVGAGKTSLLKAIEAALGGRAHVHEHALNTDAGEEGGFVDITLNDGLRVVREVSAANPKGTLKVIGADGGKHGQTKLNEIIGEMSFDPQAFFLLDAGRQREIVLDLESSGTLRERIQKISAEHDDLYEKRTPHISRARHFAGVERPEGLEPDPPRAIEDVRADFGKATDEARDANRMLVVHEATKEMLARQEEGLRKTQGRIAELRGEIEMLEADQGTIEQSIETLQRSIKHHEGMIPQYREAIERKEAIEQELIDINVAAQKLAPWRRWHEAQDGKRAADAEVEKLEAEMAQRVEAIRKAYAEASFDIEGLSFSENGAPLMWGRPIDMMSGGERIDFAVKVAFAADPTLAICLIDEANDIGLDEIETLDRLAKEKGFQIFACRLGLEGPGTIVVENGRAASHAPGE